MKLLKRLPLEFYILFLPSLAIVGLLYFSGNISIQNIDDNSNLLGSHLGRSITFLIIFVIVLRIALYMFEVSKLQRYAKHKHELVGDVLSGLFSAVFISSSIVAATCALGTSALYLFTISPIDKVIATSTAMMNLDLRLFGSYVPFSLQGLGVYHPLEVAAIWSYSNLLTLLPIFAVISLFKKEIFRKFILSFFIAVAISWPIWYVIPALQPGLMFKTNLLKINIPTNIVRTVEEHPSSKYGEYYIGKFNNLWTDREGKKFSTSNNPSMHVAWGVFFVFYSIEFFPYLGLLSIPWFILNIIGTMYTLQHYAIDVIGGLIVGCITIYITKRLLIFEKSYFRDDYKLLSFFDLIQKSFK